MMFVMMSFLILAGCKQTEESESNQSASNEVQTYLNQQLQKDKQQITQSLNSYFQCRYDYSARKAEMCSHILVVPDEAKMIGSCFGLVMEQNYSQEQLAVNYFKLYSLAPNLQDEEKLKLPYQIMDYGIEKVCSNLGKYEIMVTEDRRSATVNCGDQKIFKLEYWDNYWKVVLTDN